MNDQEQALHIGKMWQAWRKDDQCIQYQDGDDVHTKVNLGARGNHFTLADYPERFSVKKEPRFIYVNAYEDPDEEDGVAGGAFLSKKRAEQNAEENVLKVLIIAHPIELPPNG